MERVSAPTERTRAAPGAEAAQGRPEADGLRAEVERLAPWFHNLHLPEGVQTAPEHFLGDFPRYKWDLIAPHLPESMEGWSALDVGCNAGFYTFELARRGASVTAVDHDERYLAQARWAADRLGLADRVRFRRAEVYDLGRSRERYDLVLFMGVLYHLRYPLLGLDAVAGRVGRLMVFQSLTMPGDEVLGDTRGHGLADREVLRDPGWPVMAFVEHELEGDPTNWWVPSPACAQAMLRSAGMRVVARPEREIYVCERADDGASRVTDQLAAALGSGEEG